MDDDELNRQNLLALMYDDEPDGVPPEEKRDGAEPTQKHLAMNMVQLSAYVRRLERTVEDQGRAIKRLEANIHRLSHGLGNLSRTTRAELERKIDQRDFE